MVVLYACTYDRKSAPIRLKTSSSVYVDDTLTVEHRNKYAFIDCCAGNIPNITKPTHCRIFKACKSHKTLSEATRLISQ